MAKQNIGRFIVVPSFLLDLLAQGRILDSDLVLLSLIAGLSTKNGYCNASNKHIAKLLGKSIGTIKNKLTKLKNIGLIKVVVIHGKKKEVIERRIYILFDKTPLNGHLAPVQSLPDDIPPGHSPSDPPPSLLSDPPPSLRSAIDNKDINNKENIYLSKDRLSDDKRQGSEKQNSKEQTNGLTKKQRFLIAMQLLDYYGFTSYKYLSNKSRSVYISALRRLCTKHHSNGRVKAGREWLDDEPLVNLHAFLKVAKRYMDTKGFGKIKAWTLREWLAEWLDTKGASIRGETVRNTTIKAFQYAQKWFEKVKTADDPTAVLEEEQKKENERNELYTKLVKKWRWAVKNLDEDVKAEAETQLQSTGLWAKFMGEHEEEYIKAKQKFGAKRKSGVSSAGDILANMF